MATQKIAINESAFTAISADSTSAFFVSNETSDNIQICFAASLPAADDPAHTLLPKATLTRPVNGILYAKGKGNVTISE